jgi:hypothetical protein
MNVPTPNHDSTTPRRFGWALAGLLLGLVSPVFWALTLEHNLLQRTALAMWLAMALGLGLALWTGRGDRRARTRVVAGISVGWTLFAVIGFAVLTRLPDAQPTGEVAAVADRVVINHLGEPTSISRLLRDGPLLLVFYRGHW